MPRTPIDYSKIIIYKIVSNDLNITDCYIGHTTNFTHRKNQHKNDCYNENQKRYNRKIYKTIRNSINGWDDWIMLEIEKYPCNDDNEARSREQYWYKIENSKLNTYNPLLTKEQMNKRKNFLRILNFELNKFRLRKTDNARYWRDRDKRLLAVKERYILKKDEIKIYRDNRYLQNRDEILFKRKENNVKYTCICGSILGKNGKIPHETTAKHLNFTQTLLCQELPLDHA